MTIASLIKKPGEVDKIQSAPEAEKNKVVVATRAHHWK